MASEAETNQRITPDPRTAARMMISVFPRAARQTDERAYHRVRRFRHACKLGLEGIISKRLRSPYRSGRSRPEPDRPVNTTSRSRGRSRSISLRLCSPGAADGNHAAVAHIFRTAAIGAVVSAAGALIRSVEQV